MQNISALLQQMSPAKSLGFLIQDVARPLVTSFRAVGQEVLALALAGVSEEEIQQLITLISRIRTNLTGKSEEKRTADADGRQPATPNPTPNRAETRRVS